MNFLCYCLFVLSIGTVTAREFLVTDDPPIEEVHTSYGQGDHERVTYIRAVIRPNHINTMGRNEFPRTGYLNDYFNASMAHGDERGHLVGSQFSGSAEWYNLSPQNARVNRNSAYQSITTDWFGTECEVRRFLNQTGDPYVVWEVNMDYIGDSNRPNSYRLQVTFFLGGTRVNGIDTTIHNPLSTDNSTFWLCSECGSNRHEIDQLRKDGKGCSRVKQ